MYRLSVSQLPARKLSLLCTPPFGLVSLELKRVDRSWVILQCTVALIATGTRAPRLYSLANLIPTRGESPGNVAVAPSSSLLARLTF